MRSTLRDSRRQQIARGDARGQRAQVAFQRAVFVDERRLRASTLVDERLQRRGHRRRAVDLQTQTRGLHRRERMRGGDLLGQFEHAQAVARGDRAHADLVLIVRFGRTREHARRHRLLQRFGRPCRR